MGIEEHYVELRDQRAAEFHDAIDRLWHAFGTADRDSIRTCSEHGHPIAEKFDDLFPESSKIGWVGDFIAQSRNFNLQTALSDAEYLHLFVVTDAAIKQRAELTNQQSVIALDFDKIYAEIADQHELKDLFDKLIEAIRGIVASGHIDSIKVKEGLNKIAADLEQGKTGSFGAGKFSILRARKFIKHLGLETLRAMKVPGILMAAYEKADQELNAGFEAVEAQFKNRCMTQDLEQLANVETVTIVPRIETDDKTSGQ